MPSRLKYSKKIGLKDFGLRVTRQRLEVLDIFENAEEHHLSVYDVYEALKNNKSNIGISTIYRVVSQFEAVGILKKLNLGRDQSLYELDYGRKHDHIICFKCNAVEEFVDPVIEFCHRKVAAGIGAKIIGYNSIIYTRCSKCSKEVDDKN